MMLSKTLALMAAAICLVTATTDACDQEMKDIMAELSTYAPALSYCSAHHPASQCTEGQSTLVRQPEIRAASTTGIIGTAISTTRGSTTTTTTVKPTTSTVTVTTTKTIMSTYTWTTCKWAKKRSISAATATTGSGTATDSTVMLYEQLIQLPGADARVACDCLDGSRICPIPTAKLMARAAGATVTVTTTRTTVSVTYKTFYNRPCHAPTP